MYSSTAMSQAPVLVVEDDKGLRHTLKMLLTLEGYPVFCAENGLDALQVLEAMPKPGLILLDLMMPVMNGWQFIGEIEKRKELASIPIVIVSAYQDKAGTIQASGFVKKPVVIDELLSLVKRFCGSKAG